MRFRCLECKRDWPIREIRYRCGACGGLLEVEADWTWKPSDARGVWRYRSLLPTLDDRPPVTLQEGGTPLVRVERLAKWAGVRELHVKVEGANPTGSFKDRGMTAGVTLARSLGATALACASTGNTSASLAAYGARAGLKTLVLVPAGKTAAGKLAQSLALGARVVEVEGGFDEAMALVEQLSAEGQVYLLNSLNPLRLEGQKTLAFEVLEAMTPDSDAPSARRLSGGALDRIVFPVGNGGNISAAHKAIREANATGLSRAQPMLTGVQAAGAAPLATGSYHPVDKAETIATAIRIGRPVNASKALRAVKETGGAITAVPDADIIDAQRRLAQEEGLFVEPASAAPLAGLKKLVDAGVVSRNESVVLVATGNGMKDPDAGLKLAPPAVRSQATLDALRKVIS